MVYIEYQKNKNVTYETITINVSDGKPQNYTLIQFSNEINGPKENMSVPNTIIERNDVVFNSPCNYGTRTFCFTNYTSPSDKDYRYFEADVRLYDKLDYSESDRKITLTRLIPNKTILPIFDTMQLQQSGLETTFSTLRADFNGKTTNDFPKTMQEVRIWEGKVNHQYDLNTCKLLFTGYVNDFSLPEIKTSNDDVYLDFNLISPMTYTTKRYIAINGEYILSDAIRLILQPLYNDGYNLESLNISANINNQKVSLNYYYNDINTIINDLASKYNFYWYIDNNKKIYIQDLTSLFSQSYKLSLNEETKTDGLYGLKASVYTKDYFNSIIAKNVRVYESAIVNDIFGTKTMKSGDTITFKNPIVFKSDYDGLLFNIWVKNGNYEFSLISVYGNSKNNKLEVECYGITNSDGSIGKIVTYAFSDDETSNADIVFERDSFFSNLITGFRWNYTPTLTITKASTNTMLSYKIYKMNNTEEIEKQKGYISDTGIVEKVIDLNESWYTAYELEQYLKSLFSDNIAETTEITIELDEDYNLNVGDLINVNYSTNYINGDFIITDTTTSMTGLEKTYSIVAKNYNLKDNYIDLFKKDIEQEEETKYKNIVVKDI